MPSQPRLESYRPHSEVRFVGALIWRCAICLSTIDYIPEAHKEEFRKSLYYHYSHTIRKHWSRCIEGDQDWGVKWAPWL